MRPTFFRSAARLTEERMSNYFRHRSRFRGFASRPRGRFAFVGGEWLPSVPIIDWLATGYHCGNYGIPRIGVGSECRNVIGLELRRPRGTAWRRSQ